MNRFYYSDFRQDVQDAITTDLPKNVSEDEAYDFVREWVDNACIYYADCWAIANDMAPHDWTDIAAEFGEINNITKLAYCVLLEHTMQDEQLQKFINNHLNKQ